MPSALRPESSIPLFVWGAFNRRYHRVGHLFQNRYKSIVVEEEPYLLELVRYLHLNPLRAQVAESPAPRPLSLNRP